MSNVLDSIAPSPDNLILYAMMALCDLTVFIFFIIRYFIIYAVAVLCTIIAVMLVPDWSRDFAKKTIDHIIRILLLQPVAIFFTSLGILALKGLPENSGMQAIGYICLRSRHIINSAHLLLYVLIFTIKVANRNSNN